MRWFAPADLEPIRLPEDFTAAMLCLAISICGLLALAVHLAGRYITWLGNLLFGEPNIPYRWLWYLLLGLVNVFLICNLLFGVFLAPNLTLPLHMVMTGVILQAAVVVVMPWSIGLAGLLIFAVSFLLFALFPMHISLDYFFEFAGLGLALLLVSPSLNHNDRKIAQRLGLNCEKAREDGVMALRIALGAQLIELALQNKIMAPQAALWFVEQNPFYNFFPALGFESVSNLHFVLFIGLSEAILGLLLMFNIIHRIILIMLMGAFAITGMLSGGHELTGHIPILGVVLVLLAEPRANRIKRYHTFYEGDFHLHGHTSTTSKSIA